MPELPEVETIRRQLAPLVEGRRLMEMEILDARWSRPIDPAALAELLVGRRVLELGRRGKYLLWHFEEEIHLAQHLRMTGAVLADPDPEPSHTRVRMLLGPGGKGPEPRRRRRLAISDPRRFGTGEALIGDEALERFLSARLGYEPFDEQLTGAHLRALRRGAGRP